MNEKIRAPYICFLKYVPALLFMCRKSPFPVPHLHRPRITHKFCMTPDIHGVPKKTLTV